MLAYWTSSSKPAAANNLGRSDGFFIADEEANLELKCTSCFFKFPNWISLASRPGGGESGGDSGISSFGDRGRVKLRKAARLRAYGESGSVGGSPFGPKGPKRMTSVSSKGSCNKRLFGGSIAGRWRSKLGWVGLLFV